MANLPNLLSCLRILCVPILLGLAWTGRSSLFVSCLLFSLLTDAVDGYLARRLKCTSALGARLDSWGDFATWLILPLCAWWLRPDVIRTQAVLLGLGTLSYVAAITVGFLKYSRLTSYHTWIAKSLVWLIGAAALVIFAGGPGWPLRAVMPVVALSQLEEIAITLLLPHWRADVPSVWHALRIRRQTPPPSSQ